VADLTDDVASGIPPRSLEQGPLDIVVLGGAGHVGLPLSLAFADAGLTVGIFDINRAALATIAAGRMPFMEAGADALLAQMIPTGRLVLSDSAETLRRADSVVVVIGTPVDEFLGPSTDVFQRAVDQIAPWVRDGALIVLRSTVYPGTTAYVADELARRGRVVDVAFCPERIAEGHALEELHTLPQVIGADTPVAGDRAEALFRHLTRQTIRTTTKEAELTKLFTNTWRYVKFAVANQFFAIADQAGVDYTNVLRAVREDYPRAADLPGPGFAAGPCLFKDTMQLAAFTSDHFPIGQAAMQINEGMPAYLVAVLERRHGTLRGHTIGILGMAFKAESDDMRSSLSFKLRKLAGWAGARVLATDPYIQDERLVSLETVLAESDILVIGAPHRPYRSLDLSGREVVDIWNATGGGIRLG
jgi:UDP-N-acetyl-D-mannosaminuronic acid dehydrogenase